MDDKKSKIKEIKRFWINQPSVLQQFHNLHGVNVLAVPDYENCMKVYFLSGKTISCSMPKSVLSEGWRPIT